jgi:hypothetical protein
MSDETKASKPHETLDFSYSTTDVYTTTSRDANGQVTGMVEGRLRKSEEVEETE